MMQFFRFILIAVVGVAVVLGAYRFLTSVPAKAPAQEKSEKGERGNSVVLNTAKVKAAGIELETAGAGVIRASIRVNGTVQPNQETLVQVTPRFPGVVRDVRKRVGDVVQKGDVLAVVESNQSLTAYELKAPMAGTVIDRQTTLGEYVSEQKPAFLIADLSTVWVDLSVYKRDIKRVHVGDKLFIDPEDGEPPIETWISYISPIGASDTQSSIARAVASKSDSRLRPGLFITGRVILAEKPVGVSIKLSALQTFESRQVVFVRQGDRFEPREVELGDQDAELAEVLFGVGDGDIYAAKNSFVVKAEMAKGADHDE